MACLSKPASTASPDTVVQQMSRHGTPTSAIGRLDLDGSSSSSTASMPAQTRAMKKRDQGHGTRQAASSGGGRDSPAAAGPSRTSGTRRTGQSAGTQGQQTRGGRAPATQADDDDDEDDSDDDGNGDDSDDGDANENLQRQAAIIVSEIFSVYTHGLLTPAEFRGIAINGDAAGTAANEADRSLRQVARLAVTTITTVATLQAYRNAAPRQFCLTQLADRLSRRPSLIVSRLEENRRDLSTGRDVPSTISDFRDLFVAIGGLFQTYRQVMTAAQQQRLVQILMYVLNWIGRNDNDWYANVAARPSYASQASFNPYRCFLSAQAQPGRFVDVLAGAPIEYVQDESNRGPLHAFCTQVIRDAQGQAWVRQLRQVYADAFG
ncbi:uncharacterized protein LTR77_002322 [Saxophila tyrrhenica]|uniref:Uncharacterized protein n=1 Tax=Saxophila tyrrhenica TaxID=1690608 RepID=A0AAV9PN16_9PEZI|nr:hypothetical protein LTR77_002322 [Saxophila tyrrhenica]